MLECTTSPIRNSGIKILHLSMNPETMLVHLAELLMVDFQAFPGNMNGGDGGLRLTRRWLKEIFAP